MPPCRARSPKAVEGRLWHALPQKQDREVNVHAAGKSCGVEDSDPVTNKPARCTVATQGEHIMRDGFDDRLQHDSPSNKDANRWELLNLGRRRRRAPGSLEPCNLHLAAAGLAFALMIMGTTGECPLNDLTRVPCSMSTIFTDEQGSVTPAGLCDMNDKCVLLAAYHSSTLLYICMHAFA
jgi:hypothetical protein